MESLNTLYLSSAVQKSFRPTASPRTGSLPATSHHSALFSAVCINFRNSTHSATCSLPAHTPKFSPPITVACVPLSLFGNSAYLYSQVTVSLKSPSRFAICHVPDCSIAALPATHAFNASPCPQFTTSLLIQPLFTRSARNPNADAPSALSTVATVAPEPYSHGMNWKVPSSLLIQHIAKPYTPLSGSDVASQTSLNSAHVVGGFSKPASFNISMLHRIARQLELFGSP